jgi:glycosyltransferase involved in cell wall biosynthesis
MKNDNLKRRLLICIHCMSSGGAERVTANLANYWATKGWDITIVTLTQQNLDFYELLPSVKRISLELAGDPGNSLVGLWQNISRIVALRRVLKEVKPDIALGMMTAVNVVLAFAALGLPKLRTIGAEHNHPPQKPLGFLWETLRSNTYGLLDAVTALASEGESWIKSNTNAKRIFVIPNAVTWPLPEHEPKISPSSFHQPERQLLLAVGRLHNQKGFDWLIEAFSNLTHKHPNWDLVILGEGSLRSALERQVKESGSEKRIFLPGRVGNLSDWYKSADIYVMSSRYEGFGNTLVEAMAHGLAVLSFDCDTGPRDIIRHEVDGLLVPPKDIAALTATLDKMMGNDALRSQLAERAIDARERFSMEKITKQWEHLFDEVLKEQSST